MYKINVADNFYFVNSPLRRSLGRRTSSKVDVYKKRSSFMVDGMSRNNFAYEEKDDKEYFRYIKN